MGIYRTLVRIVLFTSMLGAGSGAYAQVPDPDSPLNGKYILNFKDATYLGTNSLPLLATLYAQYPRLAGKKFLVAGARIVAKSQAGAGTATLSVGGVKSAPKGVPGDATKWIDTAETSFVARDFGAPTYKMGLHDSGVTMILAGSFKVRRVVLQLVERPIPEKVAAPIQNIVLPKDGLLTCSPQVAFKDSTTNYECTAAIKISGGKMSYTFFAGDNRWNTAAATWVPLEGTVTRSFVHSTFGNTCSATFDPKFGIRSSTSMTRLPQYNSQKNMNCALTWKPPVQAPPAAPLAVCPALEATVTKDYSCKESLFRTQALSLPRSTGGRSITWSCTNVNPCANTVPPNSVSTGRLTCIGGQWKITTPSNQSCQVAMPTKGIRF